MPRSAARPELAIGSAAEAGGAVLDVDRLSLTYPFQPEPTLRELSLRIRPGERALLLGPSGCGKSSFALCLNGLIPHSIPAALTGRLTLAGEPVKGRTPGAWAATIAYVFQDPDSQLCTLTVEDEIAFALENRSLPPTEIERRIDRVLGQVGLPSRWKWRQRSGSGRRWRWPRLRWPRFRWPWRRRRKAPAGDALPELVPHETEGLPDLPVETFVSLADRLAAQGRYAEAVRERLRGIVRELVDAGVVGNLPGYTITELASAASRARPPVRVPLDAASLLFSDIWYGQRDATSAHDAQMRQYAAQVHAALVAAPVGAAT